MTALTAYFTSTNDTLVTTARQITNSAPAAAANVASGNYAKSGTGWSELYSQGGNTTLGGSEPAASGHGWIWDVTTLEGSMFPGSGTWTPTVRLITGGGTFTVDVHVRVFKRSSGGVYTQIGSDIVATGQALSGTALTVSLGATSLVDAAFSTGDKLYIDVILNITTGSGSNTAAQRNISIEENGGANDAVITPGYVPTLAGVNPAGTTSDSIALSAPATITLAASNGTTADSVAITSLTGLNLVSTGGIKEAQGAAMLGAVTPVSAIPTTIPLAASSGTSSASAVVTAATQIPTATSAGTSTDSVAITATTQIPLDISNATSINSAAITAQTTISLAASSGTSGDSANVTISVFFNFSASSTSSTTFADLVIGTYIPLDASNGVSSGQLHTATPVQTATSSGTSDNSISIGGGGAGGPVIPLDPASSTTSAATVQMTAQTTVSLDGGNSSSTALLGILLPIPLAPSGSVSSDGVFLGPFRVPLSSSNATSDNSASIVPGHPAPFTFRASSVSSTSPLSVGYIVVGPVSIYQLKSGITLDSLQGATTSYGPFGQTFDVYAALKRIGSVTSPPFTALGGVSAGGMIVGGAIGATTTVSVAAEIMVSKYSWQDYGLSCFPTLLQQVQ